MSTQPTDAELKAMWQLHAADIGGIFHYARAVLAKWGQPAQETKGRKVFVCTHCDGVYADQPVTRCDCLPDENTFTEGWICFGAPAQAAEPVAPEPLTDGQIAEMMRDTWGCASIAPRHALEFARVVERAHGIKGGQHGTE